MAHLLHARRGSHGSLPTAHPILTLACGVSPSVTVFKLGDWSTERLKDLPLVDTKLCVCHSQDLNPGRLVPEYAHDLHL